MPESLELEPVESDEVPDVGVAAAAATEVSAVLALLTLAEELKTVVAAAAEEVCATTVSVGAVEYSMLAVLEVSASVASTGMVADADADADDVAEEESSVRVV
jgi:hypothetical protein